MSCQPKEHGAQWGGSGAGVVGEADCLLMTPDPRILLPFQSRLHQNCSELIKPINDSHSLNDTTWCDWAPFGTNRASCSSPLPSSLPQEEFVQCR